MKRRKKKKKDIHLSKSWGQGGGPREKFNLGTWFCSPNSCDLRVVCQPPVFLSFTVCGICTLVPDSVSYSIRLLRSFPSTMLFFLNWFLLSFLQQPPPRGAVMFLVVERKVLWERSEDALAYLLNSPIPRALFSTRFSQVITYFVWLTGLRLNCFV